MPLPCMTRELRWRSDPRDAELAVDWRDDRSIGTGTQTELVAPSNQNQSAAPRTGRRSHQPPLPLTLLLFPTQLITHGNKVSSYTVVGRGMRSMEVNVYYACLTHIFSTACRAQVHSANPNFCTLLSLAPLVWNVGISIFHFRRAFSGCTALRRELLVSTSFSSGRKNVYRYYVHTFLLFLANEFLHRG